jgi:hypothetical protein
MRMRWRIVLQVVGLLLFAGESYRSWQCSRGRCTPKRYFHWSAFRLDSDPLNRHPLPPTPRKKGLNGFAVKWDIPVEPGWAARSLVLTAVPAFLLGYGVVTKALATVGISEVASFMVSMPLLILAWYYSVGWLLDRSRLKRRAKHEPDF